MLNQPKVAPIRGKVKECENNTKKLYNIVSELTGDIKPNPMLPASSDFALAEDSGTFFMDKIMEILFNLEGNPKYE